METQTKIHTERRREKAKVFENHFRSGGEENERRMANNVMRGRRVYDGYLVCLDLCVDLHGHTLLRLELALVFPEEEGMMQ